MITTPHPAELVHLAHAFGTRSPGLLGHLRWCHHTPEATIVVIGAGTATGLATVYRVEGTAQVLRWLLAPEATAAHHLALLHAVEEACASRGVDTLVVQAAPNACAWWEAQGFVEQVALETWAPDPEEHFAEAEREEVRPLEDAERLALLHLYRQATGEQRATLLVEHTYAARVYAQGTQVAGVLLPLLGQGLILARHATAGLELQRWLLPVQPCLVVPEGNAAAADQLHGWGYTVVSTSVRLVRGNRRPFRPELVYAWPW